LNVQKLDCVKVGTALFPVFATILEHKAHARLKAFQHIAACANWFLPIGKAIWHHNKVIIAQDHWEVSVAAG
jgi:hypothetical protein